MCAMQASSGEVTRYRTPRKNGAYGMGWRYGAQDRGEYNLMTAYIIWSYKQGNARK